MKNAKKRIVVLMRHVKMNVVAAKKVQAIVNAVVLKNNLLET